MMKYTKYILAAITALAFASCNTVAGFGSDVEATGDAITESAHNH